MIRQTLTFGFLIAFCYSFPNEFTIYSGVGQTGNSITVREKVDDLLSLAPKIISNSSSYCVQGYWNAYTEKNFSGFDFSRWADDYVYCLNSTRMRNIGSLRYKGPPDTDIESISLYSGSNLEGTEMVIDKPAYTNIPFIPKSLVTTAWSNWTLYNENNFEGYALCYTSTRKYHYLVVNETFVGNIKSILKGCNRKIDTYLYPDMLDTKSDQATDVKYV